MRKLNYNMRKLKEIIITFLIAGALTAVAQFSPETPLFIKIIPESPEPGSEVRAELVSYNSDLDLANITWTLDGKTIASGVGVKQVSFTSAKAGSKNLLKATAIDEGGQKFQSSAIIRPASVTLLVESKSHVPPWYKGAALPSADGRILVTAMPEFYSGKTKLSPASLIYEWRVDGEVKRELSGRGKQNISASTPNGLREIEVKVSSADGTFKQTGFVSLRGIIPEILFYERSSSGLITSKSIKTKTVSPGTKFEVEAIPFFINYSSPSDLKYSWKQNGDGISPLSGRSQALSVEAMQGSSGQSAQIEVAITNVKNIFENVINFFNVEVR